MEFDEKKLQKSIKKSKYVLVIIIISIIVLEVLRWFFDKN